MPTEKYAHAPEILEHCQRIGKQFGLYDNALFHTEVTDLAWDEAGPRWVDPHQPRRRVHRQFVGHGHRPAARAEAARASRASSRSRATRSTPAAGTTTTPAAIRPARRWTKLADKRVAIIGTGATSVQCVPHLARACKELYVVPAHAVVGRRARQPADRSGVVRRDRHARLAAALAGELHRQPDRAAWPRRTWCRTAGPTCRAASAPAIMALPPEERTPGEDDRRPSRTPTSRRWRRSAPASTRSSRTARPPQNLKAWYRQLCKRPCFHDEYLQAFNEPGHAPGRHRRQGRRADHRDGRRGRRRRVRGRLHHLRLRLRGRHRVHPPRRLRPDRPGRGEAVGGLGRGHAHQARHPRARLPERVLRAADPGREPDLQRAAQPDRVRPDHRRRRQARARQRRRARSRSPRRPRTPGSSCCSPAAA